MTQKASLTNRVGSVLDDKWRLTELIGEGGMAAVYGASHLRNGGVVAIKILSPASASDAPLAARFLTEGYVANRVGHKGCVRVLDDGRTPEGTPYLVMERLIGSTLDALAHATPLPVDDVLRYGIALAEVLAAAHVAGIVHRDIKPENLFICDDGTIKVLDFGIAQLKGMAQEARITVAGQTLGTPAFMPPEQVLGHWDRVGPASDVYAAGGTLFNLLTGEYPHDAETAQEFMVRAATEQARPVRTVRPDIPPALADVIDRALSHAPEARFENGAAMLEALRAVSQSGRLETLRSPLHSHSAGGAVPASTGRDPLVREPKSPARASTAPVSSASRTRARRSWTPLAVGLLAIAGIGGSVVTYITIARTPRAAPVAAIPSDPSDHEAPTWQAMSDHKPQISFAPASAAIASNEIAQAADTPRPTVSAAPGAIGAPPPIGRGLKPTPTHDVATARPQPTSTPGPSQHPTPDPADPLGFH